MPLTNIQKAAVFLKTIDPSMAIDVLKRMDPGTVSAISAEMIKLTAVTEEDRHMVMKEYSMRASRPAPGPAGRAPSSRYSGEDTTASVGEKPSVMQADRLMRMGSRQIAELIKDEHPMVIGLLLSSFDPAGAALILDALPREIQLAVLCRIAGGQAAFPSAKEQVMGALKRKLQEGEKIVTAAAGAGPETTAEILSFFTASKSAELIHALKQHDEKMGAEIQDHILTFDTIFLKIEDDKAVQAALDGIRRKDLALALRKSSDATRERVFRNMPAVEAEMLKEDILYMGKQKIAAIEEAQHKVVAALKDMAKSGIVSFAGVKSEEEDLV